MNVGCDDHVITFANDKGIILVDIGHTTKSTGGNTQIVPPSMVLLSYGGSLCSSGMLGGIG